jgi:hypothetical protein
MHVWELASLDCQCLHVQLTKSRRQERQLTLLRGTLVAGMPEGFGDETCDIMLRLK